MVYRIMFRPWTIHTRLFSGLRQESAARRHRFRAILYFLSRRQFRDGGRRRFHQSRQRSMVSSRLLNRYIARGGRRWI